MSESNNQIIFKQLFDRHSLVEIPMIQRDYAQGRPLEREVRERFLGALYEALTAPADDAALPLNLDFVYGSVEGAEKSSFLPLDGQQRLTTLFLLHWYLAWQDECLDEFQKTFVRQNASRFSYSVRPSSKEFFNELVRFVPAWTTAETFSPRQLIVDQPWYFRSWRLDPSVQSSLTMLDTIHRHFRAEKGLYGRLCDAHKPAITFQLLDLEHFGLSDDLYIKMNARGKPLTAFETFKARYEKELESQFMGEFRSIKNQKFSVAEFVARRMDTTWSDLFWVHRDKRTNLYDDAIMNFLRAVALVSLDPENSRYADDVLPLRNVGYLPSYSEFKDKGWLGKTFTRTLISVLETWSGSPDRAIFALPDTRYFDENAIYDRLASGLNPLTYAEVVQFAAYTSFIREHEANLDSQAFQEWMRVVVNLATNTSYFRPSDLQRSILGLQSMLSRSGDILQYLADPQGEVIGFNQEQIVEEKLKAELILADSAWRPLIDRAEGHGYFKGQIEFLLSFSGVSSLSQARPPQEWDSEQHSTLRKSFELYLKKAESMFGSSGLIDLGRYRWQRALLTIGDYLLPSGNQNYSFLINPSTEPTSWKRLLRGTGPKVPQSRQMLKQLWDQLNDSGPLSDQLDAIIAVATGLESWRAAFVKTPESIAYCGNQLIRWNSTKDVYLLKKSQMNGAHAELFSYCFYQDVLRPLSEQNRLAPLTLREYQSVSGTDNEPYIWLSFSNPDVTLNLSIRTHSGKFQLITASPSLQDCPTFVATLRDSLDFTCIQNNLFKVVDSPELEKLVLDLVQVVEKVF